MTLLVSWEPQPLRALVSGVQSLLIRAIRVIRLTRDSDNFLLTHHALRITITPIAPLRGVVKKSALRRNQTWHFHHTVSRTVRP